MNALVITRRELSAYLVSPLAYFIGAAFLFTTGAVFFVTVALNNVASLSQVFHATSILLFLIAPVLTMRLLATEVKVGTLELLLTAPVRGWEVVLGKFLSAVLLFLMMLAPTSVYLLLLTRFGRPDLPVTLSGYLGVFLLGIMLMSLGVLASALSTNQLVAAVLAIGLSLLFWLVGGLGVVISGGLGFILSYLSVQNHFTQFVEGLIALNHIVYFLSVTAGALFIATYIIQVRR